MFVKIKIRIRDVIRLKGFLEKKAIPNTEDFLMKQAWKIDRWDGVVSLENEDYNVNHGGIILGYRKVITSLTLYEDGITFDFKTTKDSRFLKDKHMKTIKPEKWFELIEELATILAKELGLNKVIVGSGKNDKPFLLSKGYELGKHYRYHKIV